MNLPTHDDVVAARARLAGHIVRTPVLRHPLLDERTGGTILLKPETLQRTGSFKLRGATNAHAPARRDSRALAWSPTPRATMARPSPGCRLGRDARDRVHAGRRPAIKIESTRRWGAEIIHYDRCTTTVRALTRGLRRAHRRHRWCRRSTTPTSSPGRARWRWNWPRMPPRPASHGCAAGVHRRRRPDRRLRARPGRRIARHRLFAVEPEGWDDTARSLAAGERLPVMPGGSTLLRRPAVARCPARSPSPSTARALPVRWSVTDAEVLAGIALRLHPSEAGGRTRWRRGAGGAAVRPLRRARPSRGRRHQRRQRRSGDVRPRACRIARRLSLALRSLPHSGAGRPKWPPSSEGHMARKKREARWQGHTGHQA